MSLYPAITDEEKAKIVVKHEAGWTKSRICKKFHRTHLTVTAAIDDAAKEARAAKKAKRAANKDKVAEANKVLEGKTPDNDAVLTAVSDFCATLLAQTAEIKRLTIDVENGVYEADFTTIRRFRTGS
jgi:hypothetical protein